MRSARIAATLVFALGLVGGPLAAKEKPAACVYSDEALPEPAEKHSRSGVTLIASSPAGGEPVHPSTVIAVDVEYYLQGPNPGEHRLSVNFAELMPSSSTYVSDPKNGEPALRHAQGRAHLCVPIGLLFRADRVRWPLEMFVSLQKANGPRSFLLLGETRRLRFPSPDLSAKTLERVKLSPPVDYYRALEAAFAHVAENTAAYAACVARFPESRDTLDEPFKGWKERNAAVIQQLDQLELERLREEVRGTTANADAELRDKRQRYDDFMQRQADVNLRSRCVTLHLIFAGDAPEFIGRYLRIINEDLARRTTRPAATK
jgi:hypothetical protein